MQKKEKIIAFPHLSLSFFQLYKKNEPYIDSFLYIHSAFIANNCRALISYTTTSL